MRHFLGKASASLIINFVSVKFANLIDKWTLIHMLYLPLGNSLISFACI